MKVAIVGSRNIPVGKHHLVTDYVNTLPNEDYVVSGGADGVDSLAEHAAKRRGMPVTVFCVDKRGLPPFPEGKAEFARRAFARNRLIVMEADRVVAFWDGRSGGTSNTIDVARKLGRSVEIIGI